MSALRKLVHEATDGLYSEDREARECVYDCPACTRPLRFAFDGTDPVCDGGCTVEAVTAAAKRRIAAPPPAPAKRRRPRRELPATLRGRVLAALERFDCAYVTQDAVTATCPTCERGMSVAFVGAGVRFTCVGGCSEAGIAGALGLRKGGPR